MIRDSRGRASKLSDSVTNSGYGVAYAGNKEGGHREGTLHIFRSHRPRRKPGNSMRDETAAGVAAVLAARKKIQLGQHVGADVLMGVDVMTAPGDQLEAFDLSYEGATAVDKLVQEWRSCGTDEPDPPPPSSEAFEEILPRSKESGRLCSGHPDPFPLRTDNFVEGMDVDEPSTSPTAAAELQAPMSGLRISTNASRALSPARLSRPTRPPVEPSPASSSGRLDGSPPQGVRVSILASECGVTVAMAGGVLGTPVAEFQLDPDFDYDNVSLTPKWVVPR